MITPMTKVHIAGPTAELDALLRWLQEEEIFHVAPLSPDATVSSDSRTAYHLARLQGALEFLGYLRKETGTTQKRSWKNLFAPKPTARVNELHDVLATLDIDNATRDIEALRDELQELTATQATLHDEKKQLTPWRNLTTSLTPSVNTVHRLVEVPTGAVDAFTTALDAIATSVWQEVYRQRGTKQAFAYVEVIAHRDDEAALDGALTASSATVVSLDVADASPHERLESVTTELKTLTERRDAILQRAKELLGQEAQLQRAYDALLHKQEQDLVAASADAMSLVTVLAGWIPTARIKRLTAKLGDDLPQVALETVKPADDETPPVSFTNSKLITPFEAVTDIFGKPKYTELDPTPALSLFFLAAFGLALTDAGYGIVLMLTTTAAQYFFKLKTDMRKMVQLLFYAGASTTLFGALTGGWFGIQLESLPPSTIRDGLLSLKLIDPVSSPIGLLMVAFAIGIVQLLFAWAVFAYDQWRKGERAAALLDGVAWITMVVFVLAWAATQQGILAAEWGTPLGYAVLANAALLIVTQGRQHKNPLLKLGAGVLSLYGLVSFLSDVLSYSRLLALGLATGIIGLVVNMLGGMAIEMIPVVGVVLAIIVLIGGHLFNLGINALGAFIHSGRLQFVEFFPKFMEGGGVPYKPFGRVSRYTDNPNDYV